ncbi:Ppx/GppA phosphatase family protein [Comamonas sp.]|uniref:Ppx/GppA phosphatase family protein n=1 Tax=Comamonas sp. TaxID=34028 RepID=UPI0028A2155C|nr:Ppx/GppA phosphatase family protein [Comamonas sp.]
MTTLMLDGTLLAAVDLGSNSFRLEVGRYAAGHIERVQYFKEMVRQGAGLDEQGMLTAEAMQRGWDCLARFAERLAGFPAAHVRAVATQTLREARNSDVFIQRANQILGYPISIISGPEEARLIYQGAAHSLPPSDERRLVVDIGGRSTELILGQRYTSQRVASFPVGSVAWSLRYFPQGEFSKSALKTAQIAAQAVMEEAAHHFVPGSWDSAYGTSGTANAIADMLALYGGHPDVVTREQLHWLCEQLLAAGNASQLRLEGLKEERRAVIGGGVTVLCAVFDLLQIQELRIASGALRQGLLRDMVQHEEFSDIRHRTIAALKERYQVDRTQAGRVQRTAAALYEQARRYAGATEPAELQSPMLDWASQLHEIGCLISHTDHHHHGAYVLGHSDVPGFTQTELSHLAALVLAQHGKLRKVEAFLQDRDFALELLCLRLATLLCHARRDPALDQVCLRDKTEKWSLKVAAGWAEQFPQSAYLLEEEVLAWQKTPYAFQFKQALGIAAK